MSWCRRLFGLGALVGAGLLAGGCAKDATTSLPQSRDTPMILSLPDRESHTVRSQQPEAALKPPPVASLPAPPPSTAAAQTPTGLPEGFDTRFAVRVRAWVNNKAIFDDEVRMRLPREAVIDAFRLPPDKRDEAMQKAFQQTLDSLIDMELLKQDALHKLEKNPTYLQKIQTEAAKEAEKRIKELIKATGAHSPEEFKKGLQERGTTEESLRGQFVREFIAGEYVKVIIFPILRNKIGHKEIEEYYQEHLNEFQTVDRVKWQDIFILVGEKHPTMAHARQFAQYIVELWKQGADISQLMKYDEGEGRFHEGAGIGQVRGEIKPSELERWLFGMKDGEIGPLLELGTGVHVFRVVKREFAGVMEFDDKTQQMIGNKLKSEMYERERKRLIHDLREKATIEIVRSAGN